MKNIISNLNLSRIVSLNFYSLSFIVFSFLMSGSLPFASHAAPPLIIGLDADLKSGSARSGEAIRRGTLLAIEEINAEGGVLGRQLKLVARDHRGNPARGDDNINEFAEMPDLVAVMGGLHTPVAMEELEEIHKHKIIYLGPWAAGTPVVSNGYQPNYVFRVSVRDQYAGGFLIGQAVRKGYKRPGLLLEQTGWGRSNEKAMKAALDSKGLQLAELRWFHWGIKDFSKHLLALKNAGADVVMLVANAPEGVVVARSMAKLPKAQRLPIISHWGITGGKFPQLVGNNLEKIDFMFLQTFSFLNPPFPDRAAKVAKTYCARFPECNSVEDIFSPVGTAHAYDLIHLLKLAIEKAGTHERSAVRDALEQLGEYRGLLRNYAPAFTPEKHDALDASDMQLARYNENGVIIPAVK